MNHKYRVVEVDHQKLIFACVNFESHRSVLDLEVSVLFDVEKSVDHHDPPDSHIWYANEYFLQSKVYSKKMAVYV